ncbi:MAG TPA: tetratricopeptide repeat protein [Candidatus Acidoferrum sp.]|nr:tetratricopeptide repeat protein [Candidatus Acidoferrum sp.]
MKNRCKSPLHTGLLCLALGCVTLAVFWPSLHHDFIRYDDQQYVTENARVQAGLSWSGLAWAFRSSHANNWHPLTWLSHMLDCQLYGLKPAGHHLTNVLLHTADTLLLFLLLCRMTGARWRSAAVAALFAWHPLHVESVAWVAERKDLLSALFFMLTLWAYVRYVEGRGAKDGGGEHPTSNIQHPTSNDRPHAPRFTRHASPFYLLALLFFALGLMSKPMVVTLPCVLLLLDFWPLERLQNNASELTAGVVLRRLVEKVPFFALTAVGCALTLWAQREALASTGELRVSERVAHALVAYVHYLGALVVPRHLAVYYPYDKALPGGEVLLAGVLVALLTVLALWYAKRLPYLVVGWLWFVGMLVPVIGLVQVGEQAWADRYTYLPSIGLFIALVWGLSELASRAQAARTALPWLAGAVGIALLVGTSVQLNYWKDTRTLFTHVARVTRNNPLSATMLGSLLATEGKYDQAIEYYREALSYAPRFPEGHFYLGNAYDQHGKLAAAITEYEQATWYGPIAEEAHIRLGVALARQQKPEQAAAQYKAALKVNPESAVAHNDLAKLLHSRGRLDEAMQQYEAALRYDPHLAQAHNNLGVLLLQKGKVAAGVAQLREALRLKAGDTETQLNLAQGLVDQQQWSEAADLFAKTVTAATLDPNVHYRFAVALAHLGRTREAMSQYASALLLRQDFPAALDGLSWILATSPNPQLRNGTEAVRMAERACELTGQKDPAKLKTLAASYAEAGRFPEASVAAQTAIDLAAKEGRKDLAEECRLILASCKSAQPWRGN